MSPCHVKDAEAYPYDCVDDLHLLASIIPSIHSTANSYLYFTYPTMSFPQYQYFNVSSPEKWVAHVEINRAEKLNAFTESQVILNPTSVQ